MAKKTPPSGGGFAGRGNESGRAPGMPFGPASAPVPKALVPVPPEEFRKRSRRRWLIAAALAALAVGAAAASYWNYTRARLAVESLDAGARKLERGLYLEAAKELDRAVSLKPSGARGYFLRGQAYLGMRDAAKAIPDFDRAIELEPAHPEYLAARAAARLEVKDYRGAIGDLTRALEIQPARAEAYLRRGVALRESGEPGRALADFTRAIELAPGADAYIERAITRQQTGNHKEAIEDFTRAIEFAPDNPHTYYARARSRAAAGDEAGARADREYAKSRDAR